MANARSEHSNNPLMEAASGYARDRGWRVFPLHSPTRKGGCTCGLAQCGSIGKHPRTARGFKDASLNEPTIRAWWEEWSYANIGVATGRASGIVALDIDELAALVELIARFANGDPLPDTLTMETGSGGQHRLFAHAGGDLIIPNAQRLEGIAGLDVRGDGGYIVAPPSMHTSGCRYRILHDLPLAALPHWLLTLLVKAPQADVRPERVHTLTSVPTMDEEEDSCRHWLEHALARAYEGNRNATGFWLACQLRDAGVREDRATTCLDDYHTGTPGEGYTFREAHNSVRQAYKAGRRDPALSQSAPIAHARTDGTSALKIPQTTPTTLADEQAADAPRFRFLTLEQAKHMPPMRWLIEGILPEGLLSIIFGEHGSFKSFLALDFALCIATGTAWNGHLLEPAPVVYVAGEGIGGMGKRIVAWERHHPEATTQGAPMWLLGEPPQLLSNGDMSALIHDIGLLPLGGRQPALIVIDTLSRSLAGRNENDQADMSLAVSAADRLRHEFKSHVALIHHSPHSSDQRTRGSTVLPGAADTLISVLRDTDLVTVGCSKQKDWAEFEPIYLRREVVPLDTEYGAGESSCMLLPARDARATVNEFVSPSAQAILTLLTVHYPSGASHGTLRSDFKAATGKAQSSFDIAFRWLRDRGKIREQGNAWMLASVVSVV